MALIITKTAVPPLNPYVFTRSRLISLLDSPGAQVLFVVAPAGFGKTTCLSTWANLLQERGAAVAWYSLEESDNDPARFLLYFLSALREALPERADSLNAIRELLRSPRQIPAETYVTLIINFLSTVDRSVYVFLDDYHCITEPVLHNAIQLILAHIPTMLRLVVGSRRNLPYAKAKMNISGTLVNLGMEDLRFSLDETRALFSSFVNDVNDSDLHRLNQVSEGWAAALHLLALKLKSGRETGSIAPNLLDKLIPGRAAEIFDYLAEEVFEDLDPEVQRFLMVTSIADQVSGDLAAALTGNSLAGSILDTLHQSSMFIDPLSSEKIWFRYHYLFRQFLRSRLAIESPGMDLMLHRKASDWFAANDSMTLALEHAIRAKDWNIADLYIAPVSTVLTQQCQYTTLKNLLSQFPKSVTVNSTAYLSVNAYLSCMQTQFDQAEAELNRMKSLLDRKEGQIDPAAEPVLWSAHQRELGVYWTIWSLSALYQHSIKQTNIEKALQAATQALQLLPETDHGYRIWAMINLGMALSFSGKSEQAIQILNEAVTLSLQTEHYAQTVFAWINLGWIHYYQGELGHAVVTFQDALQTLSDRNALLLPDVVYFYCYLSFLYYEIDRIDTSRRYLEMAAKLGLETGDKTAQSVALVSKALLETYTGSKEKAVEFAAEARAITQADDLGSMRRIVRAQETFLGVEKYAEITCEKIFDTRNYYFSIFSQWFVVGTLMKQGRLEMARDSAAAVKELLLANHWPGAAVWFQVAEAVIHYRLWHRDGNAEELSTAIGQIGEALDIGARYGWIRSFLDAAPDAVDLLRTARDSLPNPEYADFLIRHTRDNPQFAETEALSKRELEILKLVANGTTNAEIANTLIIALSTVKTHMVHLLDKLNAGNRTEAVAIARERGLL
ncbi:MAG: LuxR C-terminal-related transcriptional regulator [Solirubrobacterales bacterium]